ncbi:MAG: efflux RND transporter permease subunit [Gemmatimonadetes bacterium]|nr:efflux RND transporter permease subunit [Gemmatimonadota bacterium]
MIRWAVSRPAVVWATVTTILLSGGVAFTKLSLATKTSVELPRLQVSLSWNGASAELMETYLTSPVEGAVQSVRGVKRVNSRSQENGSSLSIELQPNVDPQITRLAILERLEVLRNEFPAGAGPPVVSNFVPDDLQEPPLLRLTMTGPYTRGALQKLATDVISPRVSAVSGVAGMQTRGGTEFGASVSYDPALLRQLGIAPAQLTAVIRDARVVRALGEERFGTSRRAVVLKDQPEALSELENLAVRGRGGRVFRLGELATVRGDEDARGQFFRINGQPAIAFDVTRSPQADAIRTAAAVLKVLDELKPSLPTGVGYRVVSNDSVELDRQLKDLMKRGAIAFLAVMLVIGVATRNVRSVALVMGTAAVSIAGTALGLYLLDIPANMLTLAGLGMGIGILVQNGIIVVERLRTEPDTPEGRARGGQRMTAAVVGATLTTAVVLFPFLYLQGDARAAFAPFASAFVMGMAWSVVAALVMVPALAAGHGQAAKWGRARKFYGAIVKRTLRWRWATLLFTVLALAVLSWGFTNKVRRFAFGGFGGQQRTSVSASLTFPRGSDPESLDRAMQELEAIAVAAEGVEQVITQSRGYAAAQMVVMYTLEAGRTALPLQMQDDLTQRAVFIGGASVFVSGQGPAFSSGGGSSSSGNYRVRVKGYSYDGVTQLAIDLKERLEKIARVRNVNLNAGSFFGSDRAFAVTLEPDRAALARHQLTSNDLAAAVRREVRGQTGGQRLEIDGEEIPVSVKSKGSRERSLDELSVAIVPTASGSPVKIGDLSLVGEREVPGTITREDQQYIRMVGYEFRGPTKLGDRTHKSFMESISVPVGYAVEDVNSSGFVSDNSEKGLWLVFGIGLALVFLAVALVFDSVWATVMVFLDLPIALGGVMAAFWWTGAAFTREAAVGVILVIGLAVNQCVLLVDAALERRRRGLAEGAGPSRGLTGAAVLRSALDRSGMIVLITLTTMASLIPLAVGTSATTLFGAIALATAGGTVAGTLGALLVLPSLVMRWRRRRPKRLPPERPLELLAAPVP